MDLIKKLYSDESFVFFVDVVKEKPVSTVLTPATLIIFCYYIYNYVRRFYPIYVNCWFCNSNFSVPYKERSEYTCPNCGQFNGFREDGSYSKPIPEQHDVSRNTRNFVLSQDDVKGSKNGLCNKCNIIQEMKIKQLASFTPTNEKYFDREIEAFKKNLEKSLKLCHKCEVYTKKILHFQEIRYNLKAASKNSETQNVNYPDWPLVCSVCLSFIVTLLLLHIGNFVGVWAMKYFELPTIYTDLITIDRLINAISVFGTLVLVYQCLTTMSLLSAAIMMCWSTLALVNGFQLLERFKARLLLSTLNILISVYTMIIKYMNKSNNYSSRLQSYDDNRLSGTPSFDISTNGSFKNSDDSEMMEVDYVNVTPTVKTSVNKQVNSLFRGMKLNDHGHHYDNDVIKPPKLFAPQAKPNKYSGNATSSPGPYSTYSTRGDFDFDTRSMVSQHSYHPAYSPCYHQAVVSPYNCYTPIQHSYLNTSQSSNTSNVQNSSEWPKMLMYSVPGIILLALHCYLLYDIKDFLKQK